MTHTAAAMRRVLARNGTDLTAIASSASISSEIRIAPSCAVKPVPTLAANAIDATTGASSRVLAIAESIPDSDVMPMSSRPRWVSTPTIMAATADIASTMPIVPPPASSDA